MDYKKAYEEALEKAKYIKENCDCVNAKDVGSLFEQVFPELRESEDEKTRKGLISFLKSLLEQGGIMSDGWSSIECEKYITWLEKQKPIRWTSEDEANMDAVWKACGQVYGIKYQGILGDWLKTLRPHENKDNKKYEGGYIDLTIAAIEEYYGDKNSLTSELVSWVKKQGEQKPSWSEGDEKNRENLLGWLDTLRNYIHYDAIVSLDLRRERIDKVLDLENWLKSLKPQQNLYDKGYNDVYSAAKYNHWKPSEEQMRVLQIAIRDYGICVEKNVLESLYNDLKKL